MPSRYRYVVIGILVLAFLSAIVVAHGLDWLFLRVGILNPYVLGLRELSLSNFLGFLLGAVLIGVGFKQPRARALSHEVADELGKVSWPTREESNYATWVVIATVLICSVFLGVLDGTCLWLSRLFLKM